MNCEEIDKIKNSVWYNPDTGEMGRNPPSMARIGWHKTRNGKTYGKISCGSKSYYAHRVAILIMTGSWPKGHVDHIDGNGENNTYSNLRVVPASGNNKNMRCYQNNKSGISGVSWRPKEQRWVARIQVNGLLMHIGTFYTLFDAAAERIKANNRYGFYEAHGRRRPL